MGNVGRAILVSMYLLASAVFFYAVIDDRAAQGEHGSVKGGWALAALVIASVAIGGLVGRPWAVLVPFVVLGASLPIAFVSANEHAIADLMVGLPIVAIILAGAVAIGLAARRLVDRFAGHP